MLQGENNDISDWISMFTPTGIKLLYKEIQIYLSVAKRLNAGQSASQLSRKELEVYYRVSSWDILPMVLCQTILIHYGQSAHHLK